MASKIPAKVVDLMAQRGWRMHHYLWHEVRNGWLRYDPATQAKLRQIGWEPPRPARRARPDGSDETILDNNSGEDFLYMHREMIGTVNQILEGDPTYPKVVGWTKLPQPGDADYPVPPSWKTSNAQLNQYLQRVKSDEAFNTQFVAWERAYTDPAQLRKMSLGEFGARIEFTIHNQIHMRWCSEPKATGMRPDVDPASPDKIDTKWDARLYDWLGDTYSSHVNSTFWKIHGWVNDRIDGWAQANGITGPIPWRGTWMGKPAEPAHDTFAKMFAVMVNEHHPDHGSHLKEMEEVARIIAKTGHFCHFYDDVSLR